MINHLVSQRYEVLEKIGEGPLFTVYKARDKAMNRLVALQTVTGAFRNDEAFMQGLQRGLSAAVKLSHPDIAQYYESGDTGDEPSTFYIVSEFTRGINLKERIRRIAPFTLSVSVEVACAISEAMQYAHGMGIVHGDLRPHNIIMSPEGVVKVTEFGIMMGVAQSPRALADVMAYAAPYHAPELASMHTASNSMAQAGTPAGDIYAVGAILYEMLTGTPLYASDTLDAIADMHAFSPIPLPRVINTGVPRSLEGIIVKCLQKKPDARYRTAAELVNDLKSVRDALRFGKPLSWSPVDVDKLANDIPLRPVPESREPETLRATVQETMKTEGRRQKAEAPLTVPILSPTSSYQEPVAVAAASSQVLPMPAKNRLRDTDERVSIFIKIAIGLVTCIIFGCLLVIAGIYASKWVEPEQVIVPKLIGKNIEEVRAMAQQKKLHLIEHIEYIDKPRGMVFRTDENVGEKLYQGHDLNVWYSKGPTYVAVPNVVGLTREQAEQLLRDGGLTVGKVTTEYSEKLAANLVMHQDVSFKKRVLHDQPVDLVVSDGPKPDNGTDPNAEIGTNPPVNPSNMSDGNGNNTDTSDTKGTQTAAETNVNPNPPDDPGNTEAHEFSRNIRVPSDGKGKRKIKIEYVDAKEIPITPIIDEMHDEGDRIHVNFTYYGKKITLRFYTDDQLSWTKTFDPAATKHEIVR